MTGGQCWENLIGFLQQSLIPLHGTHFLEVSKISCKFLIHTIQIHFIISYKFYLITYNKINNFIYSNLCNFIILF